MQNHSEQADPTPHQTKDDISVQKRSSLQQQNLTMELIHYEAIQRGTQGYLQNSCIKFNLSQPNYMVCMEYTSGMFVYQSIQITVSKPGEKQISMKGTIKQEYLPKIDNKSMKIKQLFQEFKSSPSAAVFYFSKLQIRFKGQVIPFKFFDPNQQIIRILVAHQQNTMNKFITMIQSIKEQCEKSSKPLLDSNQQKNYQQFDANAEKIVNQNAKMKRTIQQLQDQVKEQTNKVRDLQALQSQNLQLKQRIECLQLQSTKLKNQKALYSSSFDLKNDVIEEIKSKVHQQSNELQSSKETIEKLMLEIRKSDQNLKQRQEMIELLEKGKKSKDHENQILAAEKQSQKKRLGQLEQESKLLKDKLAQKEQMPTLEPKKAGKFCPTISPLFYGEIFNLTSSNQQEQQFLIKTLRHHNEDQGDLVGSNLLYRMDSRNESNFHLYIDNIPNILLIIKLQNGTLIAGFTQHPFVKSSPSPNSGGILMSLTNKMAFVLKEKKDGKKVPQAISYDHDFLIFGNSQLRITQKDSIVWSNFGVLAGHYDDKGEKVKTLLNNGDTREAEMETYEIYQVDFMKKEM